MLYFVLYVSYRQCTLSAYFFSVLDVSLCPAPCCHALMFCDVFLLQAGPKDNHHRTRSQRPRKVHELLIKRLLPPWFVRA